MLLGLLVSIPEILVMMMIVMVMVMMMVVVVVLVMVMVMMRMMRMMRMRMMLRMSLLDKITKEIAMLGVSLPDRVRNDKIRKANQSS
jgi:hypothetical protein